jgi:hypothetical protein
VKIRVIRWDWSHVGSMETYRRGKLVWKTKIGPGGSGGGIEWGCATGASRVYCAEGDTNGKPYKIGGPARCCGRPRIRSRCRTPAS